MDDMASTRARRAVLPRIPFPKSARLLKRGEFARVFDAGHRVSAPALALHWATAPATRLGIAVSRKVDPHAVGRNRIKRVLREAFREHRARLVPADYIVVARAAAATLDNAALRKAFLETLQRAGALPPQSTAGTMRTACTPTSPTPSKPEPSSG